MEVIQYSPTRIEGFYFPQAGASDILVVGVTASFINLLSIVLFILMLLEKEEHTLVCTFRRSVVKKKRISTMPISYKM